MESNVSNCVVIVILIQSVTIELVAVHWVGSIGWWFLGKACQRMDGWTDRMDNNNNNNIIRGVAIVLSHVPTTATVEWPSRACTWWWDIVGWAVFFHQVILPNDLSIPMDILLSTSVVAQAKLALATYFHPFPSARSCLLDFHRHCHSYCQTLDTPRWSQTLLLTSDGEPPPVASRRRRRRRNYYYYPFSG